MKETITKLVDGGGGGGIDETMLSTIFDGVVPVVAVYVAHSRLVRPFVPLTVSIGTQRVAFYEPFSSSNIKFHVFYFSKKVKV